MSTNEEALKNVNQVAHVATKNNVTLTTSGSNHNIKFQPEQFESEAKLTITVYGENNTVDIQGNITKGDIHIWVFGCNNSVVIGEGFESCGKVIFRVFSNSEYIGTRNSSVEIGKNVYLGDNTTIENHISNVKCTIGDDCLVADNVAFRCADGHAIYDIETNKIINRSENMVIGKHCWIAEGARILKNVQIADNTIVGTGSIVCKSFQKENIIIAGVPAKIIKEGVKWNRNDFLYTENIGIW